MNDRRNYCRLADSNRLTLLWGFSVGSDPGGMLWRKAGYSKASRSRDPSV